MESKKARRLPGAAPGGGADAAPTRGAPAGGLRRFIIPAWLRTEPPELSAVPAGEVVYFERRRPPKTEGHMRAGELLSDIRDTMARQAEGFFTLSEAAQVLAESRPDVDPLEVIDQMRQAHATGRLRVHHGGRRKGRFAVRQGEAVRAFRDLVASEELDRWLREPTGYGFPAYSPIDAAPLHAKPEASLVPPVASASTVHSTKGRRPSDTLWPAIRKAQEQCANRWDVAEVFGRLQALADATESHPPLVESTRDGISWINEKGVMTFLTRDALSKRLQRLAHAASRR